MPRIRDWQGMKEMSTRLLKQRTGEDVDTWNQRIRKEGPDDKSELSAWLTAKGVTGYAQTLLIMERFGYPDFLSASADELIDGQYADRPQLRPIFDASIAATAGLGQVAVQARKTYVDDPIVDYLPELKGRGFDPITIRNLLMMQSGIRYRISEFPWDEDAIAYFYPNPRELLLSGTEIAEPPGQSFHYTDYNTLLLGLILERATRRTPSAYLEQKIWVPLGMEYSATWSVDSAEDGLELMHAALNARQSTSRSSASSI
jgi:hypothetical protein